MPYSTKQMKNNKMEETAMKVAEKILQEIASTEPGERRTNWFKKRPPYNVATGALYRGSNHFWLYMAGGGGYVGFNQAKSKGWHVRKGAKGFPVVFVKTVPPSTKEEEKGGIIVKWSTVFAVADVETAGGEPLINPPPPSQKVEEWMKEVKKLPIEIQWGKGKAARTGNTIWMPSPDCFETEEQMWATLIHEVAHWTGGPLGRKWDYSTKDGRAMEEIVAEMTAAIVCSHLGVNAEVKDHADYIGGWAQHITPSMMMTCIMQAKEASEFLLSLKEKKEGESEAP